jgi:CRP-like cAMP-binding protein
MDAFFKLITSILEINETDRAFIASMLKPKAIEKGTILLNQGNVEKYVGFIENGIFRYYSINQNGKEISLLFTFENWFVGELSSFLTQTPSYCFIEALTEAKIWQLNYDNLQKIYVNTTVGDKFGRIMMEQLYIRKAERERNLLMMNAEERYLDLIRQAPHILQNIPLKYIASYLGITPQALSRIRKNIN